jgi:predicted helicase
LALGWIIDQYRVKTDKPFDKAQDRLRGITNGLLRPRSGQARVDDPEYIVRLIKKVVTVSVETVKIVKGLPELGEKIST